VQQDDARGQFGVETCWGSKLAGPGKRRPSPTSVGRVGDITLIRRVHPLHPSRPRPALRSETPDATADHQRVRLPTTERPPWNAVRSPDWIVTSGSLFAVNGSSCWSGASRRFGARARRRHRAPIRAVLRAVSTPHRPRQCPGSALALRPPFGSSRTERTPRHDIDGGPTSSCITSRSSRTYYVSVFRRDRHDRDSTKKVVSGRGRATAETYFTLASAAVGHRLGSAWHLASGSRPTCLGQRPPGGVRLTLSSRRAAGRSIVLDDGATAPCPLGMPVGWALRGGQLRILRPRLPGWSHSAGQ